MNTRARAKSMMHAKRRFHSLVRPPRSNKKPAPTLAELVEKKLPTLANSHTRGTAKRVLSHLIEILPAGIKVQEITSEHLWTYINHRLEHGGVAPATVNREINAIAAALHAAPQFFSSLSAWACPKIPRPKFARRRRERTITEAEIKAITGWLCRPRGGEEKQKDFTYRRRIGQMFEFALLTAMREGEICNLRWSDIDLKAGSMKINGLKTNDVRYLSPLSKSVLRILAERAEVKSGDFVFTRSGKLPADFHEILRRASGANDIKYGKETPGGLVFHDCRHTATTRLIQAGIDISTVQSITGHSDAVMVLYYSHPSKESRTKAVEVLENSLPKQNFGQIEKATSAK